MNSPIPQDALEVMQWHERQARHKQGYAPRPVAMITARIRFPELTEQERREREQKIADGTFPF